MRVQEFVLIAYAVYDFFVLKFYIFHFYPLLSPHFLLFLAATTFRKTMGPYERGSGLKTIRFAVLATVIYCLLLCFNYIFQFSTR